MTSTTTYPRYAAVTGATSDKQLAAYLPANYTITHGQDAMYFDGEWLVEGTDVAGWTLDEYVIPRLASGGMVCREQFVWVEDVGGAENGPKVSTWLDDEPQTPEAMEDRKQVEPKEITMTGNIIPLVYDDPEDLIGKDITDAVAAGARYFYDVEDTGGSWYCMLGSDKPLDDVQKAYDEIRDEYGSGG